jgi:hypothetical protein
MFNKILRVVALLTMMVCLVIAITEHKAGNTVNATYFLLWAVLDYLIFCNTESKNV